MNEQEIIKKHAISAKIPGLSVGLVNNSSTEFFNYGETEKNNGIIPTEDTIFEIASISKTFTSILLAILQKEDLLNKDDPITKFVPEFSNNSQLDKITLYHLATHTSGLPNLPVKLIISGIFSLMRSSNTYGALPKFTKSDLIKFFSKINPKTTPGTKWSYSNGALGLLGHIFERVTNSNYNDLIQSKICNDLGMKSTGVNLFESHKNKMASGHSYFGKKTEYSKAPAIEGAAGLCSTTNDLAQFLKANLGLVSIDISSELQYCQRTRFVPKLSYFLKNMMFHYIGVEFDEMGLGWWVYKRNGYEILFHDGGTAGFSSFIGIEPSKKKGVVILANKTSRMVHKLGMDLLKNY